MKRYIIAFLVLTLLPGCSLLSPSHNLSPNQKQDIGKIEGKQPTVEDNLNSIHSEIAKLQSSIELQGSNNKVQSGYLNFEGNGWAVGAFAIVTISMLLFYMYKSSRQQKIAEILAGSIRAYGNSDLNERVLAAAWKTGVEKDIYQMINQ